LAYALHFKIWGEYNFGIITFLKEIRPF